MPRTSKPQAKKQKTAKNNGKLDGLVKDELKPCPARDGAKPGDILVGSLKGNFGLAIEVLEPILPICRRGHLSRVVKHAIEEQIPFSNWKDDAAKHMDWPLHHPNEKNWSERDFIRVVILLLGYSYLLRTSEFVLNYLKFPKKEPSGEREELIERCKSELDYPLDHHLLPWHASIVDIRFKLLDPGSGDKSALFRNIMNEHQNDDGITFDTLSQCIQQETGANDATFFLNYDNMIHPSGNSIYRYEDNFAKEIRENGNTKSFLKHDSGFFERISNREQFAYILIVDKNEDSLIPKLQCRFTLLKNYSKSDKSKEWNFPSLPNISFILENNITSANEELEDNRDMYKSDIFITPGILKSLLQKQIRRGLAKEAVYTASKLASIKSIYNPQFRTSTNGSSSLLQRLIIIILEDVGYTPQLSPLCWLAYIVSQDETFKLSSELWYFIWNLIYQCGNAKEHEFYHGNTCKIKESIIEDYSKLMDTYPKASSEQLALAFGLELRCHEPGMAGDRIMLRRAITETLKDKNKKCILGDNPTKLPTELLNVQLQWNDDYLLKLPAAVDFHAYPGIVDRIFECDASIYYHYFDLSKKSKKKTTSVELLRQDIWNFSSCINIRDKKVNPSKFWISKVEPLFHEIVEERLRKIITN